MIEFSEWWNEIQREHEKQKKEKKKEERTGILAIQPDPIKVNKIRKQKSEEQTLTTADDVDLQSVKV